MTSTKLVIGAGGYLGRHVTRLLAERGDDVRILVRRTSALHDLADLDLQIYYGDVFDAESVARAMDGCDVVFYCVVDARPWLRDASPMWRTNVDGLKNVLDVAAGAGLRSFVFTSSVATIGIPRTGLATEDDENNWADRGGEYVATRVAAENLVFDYWRERGLPAVAMCVATTYGSGDYLPTPHGRLLSGVANGTMPFYVRNIGSEVVGIRDAAQALVLAADRGRPGQRYIVAERFMTSTEVNRAACAATGIAPPKHGLPRSLVFLGGGLSEAVSRLRGRENSWLTRQSVRLMYVMPAMDSTKARTELGWTPTPAPEAIAEGARWFRQRYVQRRLRRAQQQAGDR